MYLSIDEFFELASDIADAVLAQLGHVAACDMTGLGRRIRLVRAMCRKAVARYDVGDFARIVAGGGPRLSRLSANQAVQEMLFVEVYSMLEQRD